jgi:8-oxo-dGTP diphosphatase
LTIRRFGEAPAAGQTYYRRAGAYAILPRGKSLLLTCQMGDEPDVQLPGGGIDPGESPIAALHREVFEETGWHIATPRRFGTFRRFVYMPEYDLWAEKICMIFVARPVLCMGTPSETDHFPLWCPPADAISILGNAGDRHFVHRWMG